MKLISVIDVLRKADTLHIKHELGNLIRTSRTGESALAAEVVKIISPNLTISKLLRARSFIEVGKHDEALKILSNGKGFSSLAKSLNIEVENVRSQFQAATDSINLMRTKLLSKRVEDISKLTDNDTSRKALKSSGFNVKDILLNDETFVKNLAKKFKLLPKYSKKSYAPRAILVGAGIAIIIAAFSYMRDNTGCILSHQGIEMCKLPGRSCKFPTEGKLCTETFKGNKQCSGEDSGEDCKNCMCRSIQHFDGYNCEKDFSVHCKSISFVEAIAEVVEEVVETVVTGTKTIVNILVDIFKFLIKWGPLSLLISVVLYIVFNYVIDNGNTLNNKYSGSLPISGIQTF
jgi:hypothetical protein